MDIRLGSHCRHIVDSRDLVRFVRYHRCLVDSPGRFSSSDRPARNGYGSMADRQRIQSICNRFAVCENSDELAFERVTDLLYRREGGSSALPKTLPSQLHVNARGIDLKKRTQRITRRKQNVKKRFNHPLKEAVQHTIFLKVNSSS